ncbi:TIGR03086 family protein [Mycolicibacterium murale]|uniref:TIGR03086 family protein n=1 Tax=Mycolicibacterium murale TaxID=182220 RepID=A0A7I9WGC0_9MYCO|nr:TIGR03086 family metal-binding protein [Mycolicibacterium murale]MCV7182437.1 TIGR03086 family protein [Mycolicibacterium murale]GFG56336.1 TIGR03086 family protein [Mycolicibacterium murale]
MIDLTPACRRTADVLADVADHHLDGPTPCPEMTVGDLVAHLGMLAVAFAAAARKDLGPLTDTSPEDQPAQLTPDWRHAYPEHLADLARAWQDPSAWEGMTRAGGVDLPGDVAGSVALAEVVIHGWDVARSIGRHYDVDDATARACLHHLAAFDTAGTEGLFGPAVAVDAAAPVLDRIVGRSGRDPQWCP